MYAPPIKENCHVVQSLNLHSVPITQLKWAPENYYHDSKNPYTHRLASADSSGRIIIWDVLSGVPLAEASEQSTGVYDMHWISDQDISRDLLLVLHTNNKLVLWNAQTCTPIWKKSFACNIKSVSFDPFSSQNIVCSSIETTQKRFSKSIKATAKAVIGKGLFKLSNSRKNDEKPTTNGPNAISEVPLQVLYHGFRKQHIVFVYLREIVIFDLILSQCVGEIHLDQTSASFAQVYCCRQADALICLHQNGIISVHYCPPTDPKQSLADVTFSQTPTDLSYHFLCESKSLRRGRNFSVVAMSVDPSTELGITIATSDGRLQFLSIESDIPSEDGWPEWTLMDMTKTLDLGQVKNNTTPLRIRLKGFYSGGSASPTVCCICPAHFLLPVSKKIKHESLIAVGTARGTVQVWDLHTFKMWREYLLVNGPVQGLAWGSLPAIENKTDSGSLSLFVHTCAITPDSTGGNHRTSPSDTNVSSPGRTVSYGARNMVVRIDLLTGQQCPVLTQNPDTKELHLLKAAMKQPSSTIKPSKWLDAASQMTEYEVARITPIRSIKVSNFGQYLAILYENWPLEIWDARKLVLLKVFSQQNCRPVALTWSNVSTTSHTSSPRSSSSGDKPSSPNGDCLNNESYSRETFILCTSPLTLQLFTMEGSNVDNMPISSTIVQSLPAYSRNSITCASWRSPMIAFGMADGCIAVRNLLTKETLVRYMAVLVSDSNFGVAPSPAVPDSVAFSSVGKGELLSVNGEINSPSYVKKVEFMFAGSSACRLLTLCQGGVAVWEPKQMVLLCAMRFGSNPQKIIIDAAWTNAVLSPTNPSPTCALLSLDGSLRLAAAGSAASNRSLLDPSATVSYDADDSLEMTDEYLPVSQFEFNSSISSDADWNTFVYLPSLLPVNVALTIRYLLQYQPWHSASISADSEAGLQDRNEKEAASHENKELKPMSNKIVLCCPKLGANFSSVQSAVDRFCTEFKKVKHLSAPFESLQLTIVERCLLTAQLFGDTYEMAFWRVVAHQLLASGKDKNGGDSSSRWKRFGLTDLVWDELNEELIYRAAVIERINRLVHDNTPEQSKLCTQFLLMLGNGKESIKHLAETSTESPSYSFNIHRACLLASQNYIRELEAAAGGETSEAASLAKMNYTSSVKLLAANLFSSNHIQEGVEMLCMLGMHLEACRYLEAFNEWGTAVWLAKCKLNKEECEGVLRRWATYLATTANRKTLAILVLAYLGRHSAVLTLLQGLRQHQLAARYLEACQECGAVVLDSETENLHSQVFMEFARSLITIGQRESALYYAGLAGDLDVSSVLETSESGFDKKWSLRLESPKLSQFDDITTDDGIKLFDVFDDPPNISDDDECPLIINTSNQNMDEDDDPFGYDSIFKSKNVQSKQVEPRLPEARPVLDSIEDELTLTHESNAYDTVHNEDQLLEWQDLVKENVADDDESNVDVEIDERHHEKTGEQEEMGDSTEEYCEKIGIWTFSGGAAKKSRSAAKSNSKKPKTVYEKEMFAIHSESQRLIREVNADLLYYKPKEYTSVAEFKKALHGDMASEMPTPRSLSIHEAKVSQNATPSRSSEAPATSSWSLTERILLGSNFKLPDKLPPPRLLKANDDDIIDLLQDDQPVIPGKQSKAKELLSEFHKAAKPTDSKDSAEFPKTQELSILTKVSDAKTGRISLKMESVNYKSSSKKPLTFTNRHEWVKHRAELKEIMRAKKLKQYEERMKDYKPSQYPGNNVASDGSDEDEEWLEEDEMSCSSPSLSESDIDDDDDDEVDDEIPHVSRTNQKVNPFIDDEAVEDDGSEDENSDDESDKPHFNDHPPPVLPIHNPHLEPGDVDLFASDCITQTVQGDRTSASLLDRTWNATPYSLFYSQKRLPSDDCVTDSSSLEQTKVESAPATSGNLAASEPTQPMTFQGGLDDNSVVKVELNLTQLGGSNRSTEGPTQTQLIDDFEDIDPNQPLTMTLSSVKEFNKPKLVRVRDSSGIKTSKGSAFLHSTQLVPSHEVRYTSFADLDLTQNNNLSSTQLFKNAPSSAISLPKESSAEEVARPKLMRIRDVCETLAFNEPPSLPDTKEPPVEVDFTGELSQPKLDLLDPSYIQCSFATQAMVDPPAPPAVEASHKPRKRLRHNSDEESDNEASDFESLFKRRTIANSTEPLDALEDTASAAHDDVDAASSPTEDEDEDIDNIEDFDDGMTVEEEAEEVEEESSEEDEEREYLKQIRETQLSEKLEKKQPKFRPSEFIEEEAELSGDERERAIYGDGREEELDDEDDAHSLKDFVDENYTEDRTGNLRREVERVYNRIQEDEDRRNLRYLKEMFFEDGDLYDGEGQVRRRRFRWKGLDDEDPFTMRSVDLDAEETENEQEGSEFHTSIGLAGFMSRGLLRGVSIEENPSSDGIKDAAADEPRDESAPAPENSLNAAANEAQISMDFVESIISTLGRKVISSYRSSSFTVRSPKKRGALDPLQKTLPEVLHKSSSTSALPQPGRPVLTTKRGSLLSRPAPVLPAPTRSRSLLPTGRPSRQFSTNKIEMEVDNDNRNDSGTTNRCQVDSSAFGLRTKVVRRKSYESNCGTLSFELSVCHFGGTLLI
ncbi:hypothetical protein Aperf_G00000030997 [Anoplocephala perfoliata]